MNPVAIGVIGEMYIGGAGLARGYLNQPELTAKCFIANPFATAADQAKRYTRLYKTGDLVRYLPDGNIEYMGRSDFQVKINGYRIELGEIETVLNRYPAVKQVVVLVKEHEGNKYLVAYYVAENEFNATDLKNYLSKNLPDYMLPHAYVYLKQFPLTINGKLDRAALPEPALVNADQYVAPRNELEEKMVSILEELLKVRPIGIKDDFFRIGGNSILALKFVAKLKSQINLSLKISELFSSRDIESITALVNNRKSYQPIVSMNKDRNQKNTLFMIHSGFSGCEVYNNLVTELDNDYHCYGIDNYNLYHDKKIDSLHKIAALYLGYIKLCQKNGNSYRLLGWSSGGTIALEIAAILEKEGVKDITVYLLDTILSVLRFDD